MKKTLKKLLICILIILIINNFFISNISFAADSFGEWITDILGSVVGLLTFPIRIVAIGCGYAIDTLTRNVAESQGCIDANGNIVDGTFINVEMITPFDIFFNKIALIDVNFFNILNDGSIISNIRNSIAGWYYVMRMIAASILLCVLIYVGIRMAISTVASDKAAYKKMLVDWVCSLALIFLLQYIILFTFAVNDAFIKALSGINDGKALCDAMVNIKKLAMKVFDVNSIAATIVFCMLVAQTLGLLISYFNRMLKLAFLVIIAPLITLTYSIDKMGDGKAQALGTWLKEFIYTVLLQTFHCIIYMAFVSMALAIFTKSGADDSSNLAGAVLAVLCVKFTKEGEKILGKIFSFSGSTSESSLAAGMAMSAIALSSAKNIGKGTRSAVNGIKSLNLGGQAKNLATTAIAMKATMFGGKDENGNKVEINSKEEALDYANSRMEEKAAKKAEKKNSKKYGVNSKNENYQKEVDDKAKEIAKNTGVTERLAKAQARSQVASKHRNEAKTSKRNDFNEKHKVIAGARGFAGKVGEARKIYKESETAKVIKDMRNASIAAGIGTFVGSATYGAEGNAFKAITMGTAAYKGSGEFLKNSTGTLVNTSQKLCRGVLGAKNSAQAENEMKVTQAMAPILGDNQEFQRQIDELLKFVEKSLENDAANETKSTIRNTVSKNLKENPEISMDQLLENVKGKLKDNDSLKEAKTKDGESFDIDKFMETNSTNISSVAKMQARKELYDTMETGKSLGLSAEALTRMTTRGFKEKYESSEGGFTSEEEILTKVHTERDYRISEKELEERTVEARQEISEKMQKEFDELAKNTTRDNMSAADVENSQKALAENIKKLNESIVNDYMKQYETLKGKVEAEATEKAKKELEREINNLRKEFEREMKKYEGSAVNIGTNSNRNETNGEDESTVKYERVSKETLASAKEILKEMSERSKK